MHCEVIDAGNPFLMCILCQISRLYILNILKFSQLSLDKAKKERRLGVYHKDTRARAEELPLAK